MGKNLKNNVDDKRVRLKKSKHVFLMAQTSTYIFRFMQRSFSIIGIHIVWNVHFPLRSTFTIRNFEESACQHTVIKTEALDK